MSFRRVAAMASAATMASAGGTIKLDWSDCGDSSTHGHITSLSPTTVSLGTNTPLTGKGTVDETISGANYKVTAKALGITVFSHSGDACKPDTIKLPAGAGEITVKGFSCPIKPGSVELDLGLNLAGSIPAKLARTTIDLTATAASGDKTLCVQIKTSPADDREMFEHFKRKYAKTYAEEEELRFENFKMSLAAVAELNAKEGVDCAWSRNSNDLVSDSGESCPYGITPFSDMHKDEFKAKMLGFTPSTKTNSSLQIMDPAEYASGFAVTKKDWRSEGKVTAMKDQNPCGVCWAFSAVSTVESAYAIKYGGSPPVLSPEQVVECDGTHHCNDRTSGGNYEQAWQYLQQNGGLATEAAYPTTCCDETRSPKIGTCRRKTAAVKVTGDVRGPQNEDSLAAAVASKGPFSIAVAAEAWQHWTGGTKIMTQCGGQVDHAVSIVGFDKSASTPYWIVRNQWGTRWGNKGYIYLSMGHNTCQLTTEPAIATVAKASDEDVVV